MQVKPINISKWRFSEFMGIQILKTFKHKRKYDCFKYDWPLFQFIPVSRILLFFKLTISISASYKIYFKKQFSYLC